MDCNPTEQISKKEKNQIPMRVKFKGNFYKILDELKFIFHSLFILFECTNYWNENNFYGFTTKKSIEYTRIFLWPSTP